MNEQIDWGNAPEGATHYVPAHNDLHHPIWLKMEGNTVLNAGYIGHAHWAHTYTRGSQPCTDLSNAIARPTAPSWSGEGLPPVGVVCEFKSPSSGGWLKARIIFVSAWTVVLYVFFEHDEHCYSVSAFEKGNLQFRPIRTPEQIAADEREAAIEQIISAYEYKEGPCTHKLMRDQAARFYDAGLYRKP